MITFNDLTENEDGVLCVKIGEEFFPIISEYVQVRKSTIDALVAALEAARDDGPAHLRSDKLMKQIGAALALARE